MATERLDKVCVDYVTHHPKWISSILLFIRLEFHESIVATYYLQLNFCKMVMN